jgi:hypothetical protein
MTGGDAEMQADIATYGWHVIKVFEDDEGPSFAFTIGLYKRFGHPELVVFGLPLDTGAELRRHASGVQLHLSPSHSSYGRIASTGTRGLRRLTPGYGRPSQFLRTSEGSIARRAVEPAHAADRPDGRECGAESLKPAADASTALLPALRRCPREAEVLE